MEGRTGLTSSNPPTQRITLPAGMICITQQKGNLLFGLLINRSPMACCMTTDPTLTVPGSQR